MNHMKRRVLNIEKQLNIDSTGCNDPRVYYYPNTLVEGIIMDSMDQGERQEYLRTRRNRPSSQVCDSFDKIFSELNE
jgi:hypothetical protein